MTMMAVIRVAGTITAVADNWWDDGGLWFYGHTYSNYYHPTSIHGSSCRNGDGYFDSDYNEPEDTYSYASVYSTWSGNSAYWNIGER
jgi:hypothetical protein